MNRREFVKLGIAVISTIKTASLFARDEPLSPLVQDKTEVRFVKHPVNLNLPDVVKRNNSNREPIIITEVLNETNEILPDAQWAEACIKYRKY